MKFGDALRELRLRAGISPTDFSHLVDIDTIFYLRIEKSVLPAPEDEIIQKFISIFKAQPNPKCGESDYQYLLELAKGDRKTKRKPITEEIVTELPPITYKIDDPKYQELKKIKIPSK